MNRSKSAQQMIVLITTLIGLWGYGQEKDSIQIQDLLEQSWDLALEDIDGAETRALQALKMAEENKDADGIYTCYENLIHIFFFVGVAGYPASRVCGPGGDGLEGVE